MAARLPAVSASEIVPNDASVSLWDFAVRTYALPGVTAACLELQDERGADVIMLFFSLWVGTTRGLIQENEFTDAEQFSRQWNRQAVVPQRAVRTWMKAEGCTLAGQSRDDCLTLREQIKQSELSAEKIQLTVLESMLKRPAQAALSAAEQLTHAVANLRKYCQSAEIELDAWAVQRLAAILMAGVSSTDLATIESIFSG